MEQVALRVSRSGNGCGVAIVAVDADNDTWLLQISILPKFWSTTATVVVDLDDVPGDDRRRAVSLHEGHFLLLTSAHPPLARRCAAALTGLVFAETEEPDDGSTAHDRGSSAPARVRLFDEVPIADVAPSQVVLPVARPQSMWDLVEDFSALDLLRIPAVEGDPVRAPTYVAESLLSHVPELRPLLLRAFVDEAEAYVSRRRPHFREEEDELPAVRGRIQPHKLAERNSRRRLSVHCSFDELDHDSPWHRLLRAAARLSAVELQDSNRHDVAQRAERLERQLHDSRLLHPRQALAGLPRRWHNRGNRTAATSIALARGLLLGRYPFGTEDALVAMRPAVAAAVRFSSAALFERMLATISLDDGTSVELGPPPVWIRDDGTGKRPDLALRTARGSVVAYLDAKYKALSGGLAGMPMGDQYQQYAYAAASGRPVAFVYVGDGETQDSARIIVEGNYAQPVSALTVPFPQPGEHREWITHAGRRLERWMLTELRYVRAE